MVKATKEKEDIVQVAERLLEQNMILANRETFTHQQYTQVISAIDQIQSYREKLNKLELRNDKISQNLESIKQHQENWEKVKIDIILKLDKLSDRLEFVRNESKNKEEQIVVAITHEIAKVKKESDKKDTEILNKISEIQVISFKKIIWSNVATVITIFIFIVGSLGTGLKIVYDVFTENVKMQDVKIEKVKEDVQDNYKELKKDLSEQNKIFNDEIKELIKGIK